MDKHKRRSIRLPGYDYSQEGAYFVTICTNNRASILGDVNSGKIKLNQYGEMVRDVWISLEKRYDQISLGPYVVMPNHIHGKINIVSEDGRGHVDNMDTGGRNSIGRDGAGSVGAIHELPLRIKRRKMLLPKVIGYFKMNSAKRINLTRKTPGSRVWQRNYYEHIIHDDGDLYRINTYIRNNPLRWSRDSNNPVNFQ